MNQNARERIFSSIEKLLLYLGDNQERKKVIFTNGCFDILHIGHLRSLEEAKSLGDILIVGVNSDQSVRKLKGEKRPIISETERAELIAGLWCVDYVFIFDEDTALDSLRKLKPNLYFKSADYSIEKTVEGQYAIKNGIRLYSANYYNGLSTSSIINKIAKQ